VKFIAKNNMYLALLVERD